MDGIVPEPSQQRRTRETEWAECSSKDMWYKYNRASGVTNGQKDLESAEKAEKSRTHEMQNEKVENKRDQACVSPD